MSEKSCASRLASATANPTGRGCACAQFEAKQGGGIDNRCGYVAAVQHQSPYTAVLRGSWTHLSAPVKVLLACIAKRIALRIEMILRGKKLGFTLSEISDLIGG